MAKESKRELLTRIRVLLWSAPRCLSSVLERSVRELSSVKVIYEPHHAAYYHGPERKIEPAKGTADYDMADVLQSKYSLHNYDYADRKLLENYDGYGALFAKDMAYFIPNEPFKVYTRGEFSNFIHSFLIRNPHQSMPSMWKACMRSNLRFSAPETEGYQRLYELLEFVRSTGRQVIVVDAADLLSDPEATMKHYCAETGLPYDKKMLTWSPGVVEDWADYEYFEDWHWNAMYSSGFNVGLQPQNEENAPSSGCESVSPEVDEAIKKAMPYYELMQKLATCM